jgi:hypothetical protein
MPRRDTGGLAHLLLGQPDLAEQYMRALALKGELPSYTGGEFDPSITVADLTDPEYLWLRRVARLSQGVTIAAVAAQFSQAGFTAIAGANRVLAVIESLIITNSTAGGLTFMVDSQPVATLAAAAANTPKSALDDRAIPFNALQPTPNFGWVTATAAAEITGLGRIIVAIPSNTTIILPLNWVFTARTVLNTPAPSSLLVQCGTVNNAFHAAVVWRERALLASEAT